jgi:hypothetical protein
MQVKKLLPYLIFLCAPAVSTAQCGGLEYVLFDLISTMEEGGPQMKMSYFGNEPVPMIGVRGGWLIEDDLVLGLAAHGTSTLLNTNDISNQSRMELGYFGLFVEKRFKVYDNISYGTSIFAGGGASEGIPSFRDREYFVLEPEATVYFRLADEMKIGLGGSYRVFATENGMSTLGMSNFNFNFMILFGG